MRTVTQSQVRQALPSQYNERMVKAVTARLNSLDSEQGDGYVLRENFISYAKVLSQGKFKVRDYLSAIVFVTHKLTGCSNKEAYQKTFPDRYARLEQDNPTEIAAYVSGYARTKLVTLILEQSLVPTWVLNQDIYQKAVNVQADLMVNARSEMVRMKAADSLLTHLKKPDAAQTFINMDMRDSSGLSELRSSLVALAQQQKEMIQGGMNVGKVMQQSLVFDMENTGNGANPTNPTNPTNQ